MGQTNTGTLRNWKITREAKESKPKASKKVKPQSKKVPNHEQRGGAGGGGCAGGARGWGQGGNGAQGRGGQQLWCAEAQGEQSGRCGHRAVH
ncbi:hypothetical protein Tco_0684780 [Tanacetum coccineum]